MYLLGSITCFVFMIYNFFTQSIPFRADGKLYFFIALNPFVKNPEIAYIRYMRILLPFLAFLLSEFTLRFSYSLQLHLERYLVTMVWIWILNIGFYLWTCKASLKLFRNHSAPFLSFGLLAMNPILLIATINGLTDPAFYAFIFNLLCSIKENKNSAFPYAVFTVLARFDYFLFIIPYLAYESYRRRSLKLLLLIPLMIVTVAALFVSFALIFEISAIYVILNFGSDKFYIFPFVGWVVGIGIASFFSKLFVSVLFFIIILFFVTFSLDLRYHPPPQDLDIFSLCLLVPLLFAWIPLTISYTSALGRMLSACPSVFLLLQKIETYTSLTWFSKNDKLFLIIFGMISFIMVYGYFV